MAKESQEGGDEMDKSFDVFDSVEKHGFFSTNSLKLLYLYTIGSCVPKCSTQAETQSKQQTRNDKPTELEEMVQVREREKQAKKKVNRHFENHVQKYLKRFHFPWKPIFHILLVALVTAQVSGNVSKHAP